MGGEPATVQQNGFWNTRAARVTLVMCCIFSAHGVVLPFLSRWLDAERGLAGAEIGLVISLAQLARIVTGPMIGVWADNVRDRRWPFRILLTGAALSFLAFFTLAHDFWSLLVLGFLALTLFSGAMPLVEGALLRAADGGRIPYGLARGVGSMSFIIANVAGGLILARFGAGAVAVWISVTVAMAACSAWTALPADPPPNHAGQTPPKRWSGAALLARTPRYLIVIASCGLIQAAHAFYYSFSALVWREQGVPAEVIGWLWGVAVAAEVAFLWSLPRLERRVGPEALIIVGGAGALLRWVALGFAPTGLILWPLQALHALSFAATHVGAMRLIFRETPESAAGLAQTLYAALASGLLMGLSTLLSGVLYDAFADRSYWAMAAMAFAGTLIALPLLQHRGVKPAGQGQG